MQEPRSARGAILLPFSRESSVRDILAAAVFVFPGALFVRRREWERAEPIEIAAVAFACSAAFWAVSFWMLRSIPLSLEAFAALTVLASILALVFFRKTSWRPALEAWRSKAPSAAWQLAFVVVVLLLRLSFLLTRVAYSGGDMTAHAATAEEIVLADGFPNTQQPLLPISRFGEVSPGFHVLSALVSLLSGMPTYRSTILVMSVAIATATFSLYALLRRLALPAGVAAAGSASALFLARNPQFFLQWGGAPSILAAVVLLLLLRDTLDLCEPGDWAFLLRVALLGAGALLIHVLPVISFRLARAPRAALSRALRPRVREEPRPQRAGRSGGLGRSRSAVSRTGASVRLTGRIGLGSRLVSGGGAKCRGTSGSIRGAQGQRGSCLVMAFLHRHLFGGPARGRSRRGSRAGSRAEASRGRGLGAPARRQRTALRGGLWRVSARLAGVLSHSDRALARGSAGRVVCGDRFCTGDCPARAAGSARRDFRGSLRGRRREAFQSALRNRFLRGGEKRRRIGSRDPRQRGDRRRFLGRDLLPGQLRRHAGGSDRF